ncbi:MAG: MFS transporter [Nostoc sp. NMS1]|uniref:MFS transporter n=1 Tax=unclassified Nostoc TaxID=2593658 RepID=UPI0025D18D12|nr:MULTISPECIES: MFS transporter [unclassified Nostoc]MBN3909738.1 MFS transporter [Nostoc sp. NMS1]MBN3993616.1 MFS transporter [Nostoc sp. NMS2]
MNDSAADGDAQRDILNKKLDLKTKLAYGAGDLGPAITANISVFYLLIFFTSVAGIPAGLAGTILMIGKIWDGVNDPLVGFLTDKTKSRRWGRRLPWMFYGAIPFGIFFFLQWIVPQFSANQGENIWPLFWYYVAIGILSQSFYTVVNLPYTAMTPELTQDYDERTSLNSYRFTFSIGGSILSLILMKIVFSQISDLQQGYLVVAAICTVISILGLYWCVFGVRDRILAFEAKRILAEEPASLPFGEQLKIVFSNRPFLFVIGIYLFSWLGVQITASTIPYFVVNCMGLKFADVQTVLIAVQVTALLMLFVWGALSKKIGKKLVYFLGMSLWIIAAAGLFFLQPGQIVLMYVMAVMAGVGVSTAYLIPWSMIPDVIELDELQTGQRREGIFYGFMVLLQKFGLAFGLFLVGNALQVSGFKESVAGSPLPIQPESALLAIRVAVGPIPTFCLLCGLVLTYFYPITREMHAEIMLKLKERQEKRGS